VLAVYNWQRGSDRYRRVVRFIDYFFDRLPTLQKHAGFHPKWKDINLAANVPGWNRFPPMQEKLNALAAGSTQPAGGMEAAADAARRKGENRAAVTETPPVRVYHQKRRAQ
jgi:hypothetical protein